MLIIYQYSSNYQYINIKHTMNLLVIIQYNTTYTTKQPTKINTHTNNLYINKIKNYLLQQHTPIPLLSFHYHTFYFS